MGRTPCCDKKGMKKGPWSPEEDQLLLDFITANGHGSWRSLPKQAGLLRCGKSCRLRWINYLRPDIKRGPFTPEEEKLVIQLHAILGNKWASIAAQLPGRTDNEIKNLWNTHLRKRLISMGLDPQTHKPTECPIHNMLLATSPSTRHMAQWESARLEAEARLSKDSLLLVPTLAPRAKTNTDTDHFLCLWHSEVGESFRKIKKEDDQNQNQTLKTLCQSPISQASVSGMTTIEMKPAKVEPTRSNENEEAECKSRSFYIDTSSSNEIEDSSDTALQLFFDYHEQNDMTFLEEHSNDYSIYP